MTYNHTAHLNDCLKHSITTPFKALFKVTAIILSLLCTTPTIADLFIYENEWGQIIYSDAEMRDTNLTLLRHQASSRQINTEKPNRKPRKTSIKKRFAQFDHHIEAAAKEYAINPALIKAVIHAESAFNPNATSRVGAQGLMQLMPATAADYNVTDPYNPEQNIIAGTKHLRYLMKRFKKNMDNVIAAYNAGEVPVRKYKGIPPYKETQKYVKKVKKFLASYDGTL